VKAVLDTNVVVSGMFFGGVPGSVLDAWADGLFELVLSPGIIEEYRRTCEHLGSSHPGLTFRELCQLVSVKAPEASVEVR